MFLTTSLLCGMTTVAAEPTVDNKAGEVDNVSQQGDESETEPELSEKESVESGQSEGNAVQDDSSTESISQEKSEEFKEENPDEKTQELIDGYMASVMRQSRASVGTYSSELAKFPSDYQVLLKKLHDKHPNWMFVAVNTGLDWNDVVKNESSKNRSLLNKNNASLLLSKAKGDYDTSKGTYIPKDASTWVTASRPAVAYYVDPRNFLIDEYIFSFEALNYNAAYHNVSGVENVLKGTDLSNKKIVYTNTKGNTVETDITYGETILGAGKENKVSPLYLAAKIRQETGAKLTNKSISGNASFDGRSYRGYYNYYNIGAYGSTTTSPVELGLKYAKGGTSNSKSYERPWSSPLLAISGGAQYIAESYIAKGQNTVYFERFNTVVKPYYGHQYMTSLTGAASEARATGDSYRKMGIADSKFVFYIPVYKNMPSQSSTVTISKNVKTGKTTTNTQLRKGASAFSTSLGTIPKGTTVTVSGGVHTDKALSVSSQLSNPYWLKVKWGSKTGYISANYLKMDTDSTIKAGGSKQLKVTSKTGEKIYYETSDPAIAVVDDSGKVTGVKQGTCMIYAVTSAGTALDAVGISVTGKDSTSGSGSSSSENTTKKYTKYKTTTRVNYRSGAGTNYGIKGTLASGKQIEVEDGYSKTANGYTWYRFKMNGKEYYLASKYVKKVSTGTSTGGASTSKPSGSTTKKYTQYKTTTRVNYRSGAGTNYGIKGTLASGKQIEVEDGYSKTANGYTWYRFKMNGKEYYLASKYVKKVSTGTSTGGASTSKPSGSTTKKYTKYKTTTRVNYRSGAGTNSTIKGTLASGKQIEVENGYSKKVNSYTWYRFKMNNKTYYIASKYLKKV